MDTVQITLNADNRNVIDILRNLLLQMRGVSNVKVEDMGNEFDITATPAYREAMDDIANGRVYHAANAKEMFAQILG